MKQKNEKLSQLLQTMIVLRDDSLKSAVAKEILESEDPIGFVSEVLQYGCISGVVTSLIYYTDTHAFFDRYYDEIETLRFEYEEQSGESLIKKGIGDLKNKLAWFAFEETVREIYYEFEANNE